MKKSKIGIIGILFILLAVVAVSGCLGGDTGDDPGSDAYTITSDSVNGTDFKQYKIKDTGNTYAIAKLSGYDYNSLVDGLKPDGAVESNDYGVDAIEYEINNINYVYFKMDSGIGMLVDLENTGNTEEMKGVIAHFMNNN